MKQRKTVSCAIRYRINEMLEKNKVENKPIKTLYRLAKELGTSQTHITKLANEGGATRKNLVRDLCLLFDCQYDDLVYLEFNKMPSLK